jgi:hypothetical protein
MTAACREICRLFFSGNFRAAAAKTMAAAAEN